MANLLQVSVVVAWVVAVASAVAIFVLSQRHAASATVYKAIAVAAVVLGLPGAVLAFAPTLLDDTTRTVLFYLSIAAGLVALGLVIVYLVQARQPAASHLTCPHCGKPIDANWDVCPYCQYSFGSTIVSGPGIPSTSFVPSPAPEPAPEPLAEPQILEPRAEDDGHTRILHAEPGHLAWLVLLNGPHAGHEFQMRDDAFLGRDGSRCEIVLDDPAISALHARVKLMDGQFVLFDLGSSNGTLVNGETMLKVPLHDHDRVELGQTQLIFLQVDETPEREPSPAAST